MPEMGKQHILPRKKYALWRALKGICYYCKEPVDYADVWLDHILPEHLLKTPEELMRILDEYELPPQFAINDYGNWIPAHWRCNLEKGGTIFEKGTARYYISIAKTRVEAAQREEQRIIRDLKKGHLLSSLEIALSEGLLSETAIIDIVENVQSTSALTEAKVITFGLNYFNLWESDTRPDWLIDYEASDYPFVCDLLEKQLVNQLKSILTCEFYYPEASARNGETLSVRLCFIKLDDDELRRFKSDWWEILEFASYSDIYGEAAQLE